MTLLPRANSSRHLAVTGVDITKQGYQASGLTIASLARHPRAQHAGMAPYDFGGRVALVTGGGSGIGRATCLQLARDGARVLVTDVNLEAARHTLSLLPGGGEHLALQIDVTRQSDAEGVIAAAKNKFGAPPSLLVNCAGIGEPVPFVDVTKEKLDAVIDVNLKGTFIVSQVYTRALLDEGQEAREGRGAVVNIASILGKTGLPTMSHYSATKGAVISLTKTCAAELVSKGIRVNCVLPGYIATPLSQGAVPFKDLVDKFHVSVPLGRMGQPEEVAEVVAFLLSERSSYMVGACVEITGGFGM